MKSPFPRVDFQLQNFTTLKTKMSPTITIGNASSNPWFSRGHSLFFRGVVFIGGCTYVFFCKSNGWWCFCGPHLNSPSPVTLDDGCFECAGGKWNPQVPEITPPRKKSTKTWNYIQVFPKIEVPQNGWFIMENPNEMHDLGVPLFLETPIHV